MEIQVCTISYDIATLSLLSFLLAEHFFLKGLGPSRGLFRQKIEIWLLRVDHEA